MTTTITITGLSGSINYETEVIIKALKEAGLQVEVHNDNPTSDPKAHIERVKKLIDDGEIVNNRVIIETIHIPWGG